MMTSDPGNIKVILATEFDNFEKGKLAPRSIECSLTLPLC